MNSPEVPSDTNPETFYDIQEETTANLFYLMSVLVTLYASFFWAAYLVLQYSLSDSFGETPSVSFWSSGAKYALALGAGLAVLHFVTAYVRDIRPELARLGVKTPDTDDRYHRVFRNVLQEMKVATGRTDIEGYVMPTRYRTALSLEDRSRAAVIITEGTLGVLDRSEIQAVVAHEVAHVAYGDTAVKTFVHKMVSFIDTLNDDAFERRSGWSSRRHRGGRYSLGYVALILLSYGYEFLLRLLSTTISKERERRADATAVEYNRNPVALASALNKLGHHYRQSSLDTQQHPGFSYLQRSDFDSLQIVPVSVAGLDRSSFIDNLFNTHPPLDERISRLLDLANTPRENLENRLDSDGTPSFETNCVTADDGEPVVEKSFWVKDEQGKTGPLSFPDLLKEDRLGPGTEIGFSREGPMQSMGSLALFQYLLDLAEAGDMNNDCPQCEGPLQGDSYLGVPLRTCPICGGVGVNEDRMLRVVCRYRSGESESDKMLEKLSNPPAYDEDPDEEFELRTDCPECGDSFRKSFFNDSTSLVVDTCEGCGFVWFENGELEVACQLS